MTTPPQLAAGTNVPLDTDTLPLETCAVPTRCMRYTIRGVPPAVDAALRLRARAGGKSLNEAVVEALTEDAGIAGRRRKRRNLADIAGSWKTDKAIESALADQDLVRE